MAEDNVAGPFQMLSMGDGTQVPLYLISFDKTGHCTAPRTREVVLAEAASGRFTDLHLYSHGWNNVFDEAVAHYTEFFTEYLGLQPGAGLGGSSYRPLLVGMIWPSTALLAPGEEGPDIAGDAHAVPLTAAAEVAALSTELSPAQARELSALIAQPGPLGGEDARALAGLLTPVLGGHSAGGDDEGAAPEADAASLLQQWGSEVPSAGARPGAPGSLPLAGAAPPAGLEAGGLLSFVNPREIIRKATVYLMKDRAGVVGSTGVAELLREAVQGSAIRVHLTGHSYGAKVILSALARLPTPNKVRSVLLLQPAISARCFADRIAERDGRPGGYRQVLDKTVLPLFTTFSPHDRALSTFYPVALRRGNDVGEVAGPASLFAALGAVGPQGMLPGEATAVPILNQPATYWPVAPGVRVCALDGTEGIGGHGDVRNGYTEWALVQLVRQGVAQ